MKKSCKRSCLLIMTIMALPFFDFELAYSSGTAPEKVVETTVAGLAFSGLAVHSVVDTNQTVCYNTLNGAEVTCTGQGYDADYSGAQPSYTVSSDGKVVQDNVTGLFWTQSSDINDSGSVDYNDKRYLADAETYCSNLTLDGYSWRLPNIKELYSLIFFSGRDASSYQGSDTSTLTPFIDSTFDWAFGDTTTAEGIAAGDRIIDAQYASSTRYVSTTMGGGATMFGVNFVDGRIKGYPITIKKYYVRCVAGDGNYGVNVFINNEDGTISDNGTSLMWEKSDSGPLNWEQAVTSCENATTAGHTDWRLPNTKELQSIVDYSRSPDTSSSAAIDPLFSATSFINEGGKTDWGYYWSSTTHVDNNGGGTSAAYLSFGRALGYFNSNLLDVHGAGSQRSDNKMLASHVPGVQTADIGYGTFYYHGPQGDIVRSANMVRCVRDDDTVNIVTPGDLNNDGAVDLTDVVLVEQLITGSGVSASVFVEADVNNDEKIGLAEAIYILGQLVK